jgi:hypothetical protein
LNAREIKRFMHFYFFDIDTLKQPFELSLGELQLASFNLAGPFKLFLLKSLAPEGKACEIPVQKPDRGFFLIGEDEQSVNRLCAPSQPSVKFETLASRTKDLLLTVGSPSEYQTLPMAAIS